MGKKKRGRPSKKHKTQPKGKNEQKEIGRSRGADSGLDSGLESDVEERAVVPTERRPGMVSAGFPKLDGYTSDAEPDTRELVKQMNRKKKKSGGFQSMGLSQPVFSGIMKKGYKIPTPIQRKCIPVIMEGKDVVAMARTGSGKTAAFLIPMFEKLHHRSAQSGARALILSPTRELALQTLKFAKELGRFTSLKAEVILGGDKLDDQFAALHENPDIIIATPGRLLHVLVEMEMKLKSLEYVVFDEADRLFEMGFAEQLREILHSLPQHRQTLLFSATLPKTLVEFAKAGLNDPTLIRLDVETKISDQLQMLFFYLRLSDKITVLLHLLRNVIGEDEMTVVFMATKHHVEYIKEILFMAGIDCTHIYSDLDQTARKINVAKFTHKKTKVMLVTDVAARGIDIPMLDNVINYNFPGKPKLYVHRVGRVARAGRSGRSFSLVGPDELPYLLDLHVFLGRSLNLVSSNDTEVQGNDSCIGRVPQSVIDDEEELVAHFHRQSVDLEGLQRACRNASKQYLKTRPHPSVASLKRARTLAIAESGYHPIFGIKDNHEENTRVQLVDNIKNYKPKTTIFEIATSTKSVAHQVMKSKRRFHGNIVKKNRQLQGSKVIDSTLGDAASRVTEAQSTDKDIEDAFSAIIAPGSKRKSEKYVSSIANPKRPKMDVKTSHRDEDYYISHHASDRQTEQGLSVGLTFDQQAQNALLDLTQDDPHGMIKQRSQLKWERKKKKFVNEIGKERPKKIRTESGALIPASYKKNLYKEWLERSKAEARMEAAAESDDENESGKNNQAKFSTLGLSRRMKNRLKSSTTSSKYAAPLPRGKSLGGPAQGKKGKQRGPRQEVKSHEQVLKARRAKEQSKARHIGKKQRQEAIQKKMEGRQRMLMQRSKFNKRK
ncbi:ATP-dependent RNA helicase DDX54-like [Acanthaster planci]|uniref:RNA helicase n=1 Tax=Acanthaster planci TaxID=133434 RepID=A0A8B7ZHP6_ACAPL|nr:ATP-dependent RNA helicase DDX54-like [Acanthaster planci]